MTPEQIIALRAKVFLDATAKNLAHALDNLGLTNYLNTVDPAYFVWRTSTKVADISDAVTWANLTPTDAADGTATYTNRALLCQAKQINLQILIQGREALNTTKPNVRAGVQDALTNIPSGVGGAIVGAGWAAVKAAMTRTATLAEKMLAVGAGTAATPSNLDIEGVLSEHDVAVLIFRDDGTLWG